jgi:predicted adenine nucleotide alpha hydrolase (AANH) superfamily ATPase
MLRDIPTSDVEALDAVVKSIGLIDGNDVGNTVSRVEYNARDQPLGIKCQHCLGFYMDSLEAIALEHGAQHLSTILLWVHGRFC